MSQMDWKKILDKTLAGVYIIDKNGKFIYVNDIVEKATRYSKEELYKIDVFKLVIPEDLEKAREYLDRTIRGETLFYEIRYLRKTGEVRWMWGFSAPIEIDGEIYVLGNWIDVTRAKKMEHELRVSEEFHGALIEESLAPVYIIQKGKLVYLNKAAEEVAGYSKDELIGRDPSFIIHPEDREEVMRRYFEKEKGLGGVETYSYRIVRKDGRVRWITIRPVRITYNDEPAVAATVLDTTEINELNEELKKRAEYLSLLNSILRHDIGNALTTISAALELDDPKLKSLAMKKVEYIRDLIADVRELESAIGVMKPVNLVGIIRDVASRYNVEVKVEEEVFVTANEGLRCVIENIVINAFVHGGEGVKVTIEAFRDGKWAVCRITDNGKGIPDEIKPRIFEKGFSTAGGTGMGLFIAKLLVEAYGGKIEVKDNKPSGAIFEIWLPVSEGVK